MNPFMFNNMFQNMNMAQNMNIGQNSKNQNTINAKDYDKDKDFINIIVNFQNKNNTIQISADRKFSEFVQKFYNKTGLNEELVFSLIVEKLTKMSLLTNIIIFILNTRVKNIFNYLISIYF